MRSIWSGAISFGLIHIPVKLYSASQDQGINFDYLRKQDLCRVQYARVCRSTGEEVPWKDTVKGYEYQKGDYVVLTDEDFKKASPKKTNTIDIADFADEDEIDPKFFEKPYYLEPEKKATKAYILLREALKRSKKVGIARFVLKSKEHMAVLKAEDNILVLNQMRFANEIRKPDELEVPNEDVNKRELDMAVKLIDQLTTHFKPEDYKDTYTKELQELIDQKVKGEAPKVKKETQEPTEVKDLMESLRASLSQTRS